MTKDEVTSIAAEAAREMILSVTAQGQRISDAEAIATAVIAKLHANGVCPNGMDAETVKSLKEVLPDLNEFVSLYRGGKTSIRVLIVGVIGLGAASLFILGIIKQVKEWTGRP